MAGGFDWGDANWLKLVWAHVRILPELLRFGINVLWSDADVIWFKNPSHLFNEFPEVSGAPKRRRKLLLLFACSFLVPAPKALCAIPHVPHSPYRWM